MSSLNGVLPVDKPSGPTSHDVVSLARRALGTRRIGHTGTLDPFASGLLLLCLGPTTRLAEYLSALPKRYEATLRLGSTTDTDDLEGRVVEATDDWSRLGPADVAAAIARQEGHLLQVPPRYSAKRIGGERMYALARAGRDVEPEPVSVHVARCRMTGFTLPDVDFEVECSSGTYIRSIARDVGADLGVGAHLIALRRTRVGVHDVGTALPLDALGDPAAVGRALLPPAAAVAHLPSAGLDAAQVAAVRHGKAIPSPLKAGTIVLVSPEGELVAIGSGDGEWLRPRKVFA
jgi:tRNA pseudouridine55 synthase